MLSILNHKNKTRTKNKRARGNFESDGYVYYLDGGDSFRGVLYVQMHRIVRIKYTRFFGTSIISQESCS